MIPFTIQRQDPDTEQWSDLWHLHALQVNKTGAGENHSAGAEQYHPRLTFEVRYFKDLEALRFNTQEYRIVYRGHTFDIQDYDDFMERHITVKLAGVAYG